jgi:ribosome-associated protein
MIRVTNGISIGEDEILEEFTGASGPGGQNVNKVSTAVQLHFDVARSPSLPDDVRQRLLRLAGKRITKEGVLVVEARRFRHREANRRDALERLIEWIQKAAHKPKPRKRTKPPAAAERQRMESKRRRSQKKKLRKSVRPSDE